MANFVCCYTYFLDSMLVQNMPSLAVAMVVAREKNIKKNQFF